MGLNASIASLEKSMTEKHPVGVPRPRIAEATGGLLNPRTLANLDNLGTGIPGRYTVGKLVVYPVESIVEFIRSRACKVGQ